MKILYAIQGTGNGHVSRAIEIIPILQKKAEVDVLVSASQWELKTPFPIDYQYKGLGFMFGKKGGVDILQTYLNLDSIRLLKEIKSLPVEKYDLVISDFEPVSAWACQLKNKVCIGLSNQAATLHPLAPKPKVKDPFGKLVLGHYAPTTYDYGFHFKKFDANVNTPIIRNEIRNVKVENKKHITVYLPSYDDDKVIRKLKMYSDIEFHLFSKKSHITYRHKNFKIIPINNEGFVKSMADSAGIICNAGFGTTAEALYLGKSLLTIPMKTQYEQHCNAAVLKSMGVQTLPSFKKKHFDKLEHWFENLNTVEVNYPDETSDILDQIIQRHAGQVLQEQNAEGEFSILKKLLKPAKIKAA